MKFIKTITLAMILSTFVFAGTSFADPNHCDVNDQVKWEKHSKECGPYPTTTTVAEVVNTTVVDRELPNTGTNQDTLIIVASITIFAGVIALNLVRRK